MVFQSATQCLLRPFFSAYLCFFIFVYHFDLRVHVWSIKKSHWSDLASQAPQFGPMAKLLQLLAGTTGS
jgi:hypothetical protein